MDVCQDLPLVVDVVKVERATIEEMISILECLPYKDVHNFIFRLKELLEVKGVKKLKEELDRKKTGEKEEIEFVVERFKHQLAYLRQVIMDMPVRKCLATTLLMGKIYGLIC